MTQDFIEVGTVTPIMTFSSKLAEVEQKFVKAHKPFDSQCARLDFRDKLESAETESLRRHGFVKVEEIKIDAEDLEKYGDADRFELISEEDTYGDKLSDDGRKTQGLIGYTLNYRCKQRGHGIAVFVPLEGKAIVEHVEKRKEK